MTGTESDNARLGTHRGAGGSKDTGAGSRAETRRARVLRAARGLGTFESFFRHGEFRWYMLSTTAHGSAMQMQQLVRGFLVFQLTGSFAALGVLALVNALPRLVLAMFGGVLADRMSKRYLIQAGQLVNVVFAVAFALLLLTDALLYEHLLLAAFVQGTVNSFVMPSRQAMVPSLVDEQLLTNAVALNQGARNVMRLLAPALAGVLVAVMGAALVYFVMAGLYLCGIAALFRVPPLGPAAPPEEASGQPHGALRQAIADIKDGLRYVTANRILLLLMAVHLAIGMFAMPYQRMLPGFVDDVLGAGAWELGVLMTLTGLGALLGSLVIASMAPYRRGRNLLLSGVVFAVALALFAASSSVWLTMGLVVLIGVGQATRQSLNMALVQSNVTDEYRGRVMSVYMMEMGLISLGAFAVGVLSEALGIQIVLGGAAVAIALLLLGIYLFVPAYRRLD